ncbi:MAG: aldehyde dehydrogenase family protein [Anaerococcus sp.]|nr:aldehyde dehydrogenase family protein [Anaerococcus sp.]
MVNLLDKYDLYINGKWTKANSGKYLQTKSPATGQFLAEFSQADDIDVNRAVKAARDAFNKGWKDSTVEERAKLLNKIADIIEENNDLLAEVESLDNGKPIRETKTVDIPSSADHFRYFASVIRGEEDQVKLLNGNLLSMVIREPIGVVGQIVPWNFPFLMAAWKLAPALASGNTIVIHPSSSTPLSLLTFVDLIDGILPDGVLNVITGKGSVSGEILQHHPDLDKLAFTGSTEVGREVGISAAKNLIPATLELGGKSANIVFDDADMDKAIDGATLAILFNQGQVCSAGSRLFLQEGIYDEFLAKLKEKFESLKIGDPLDENTQMGSQINMGQVEKIQSYVDFAKESKATIVTGGKMAKVDGLEEGAFYEPTIITDIENSNRCAQEEIFGPVLVVQKFKTKEEVIKLANDSEYGLAGAVFTKDLNTALEVSRAVRTGRMWVNTYNQLPVGAPFGGYKKSGIGRETHKMVLDAYSEHKNIMIDLSENPSGLY